MEVIQNLLSGKKYVVMDLPLLFETGILIDFIYKIITVTWYGYKNILPTVINNNKCISIAMTIYKRND